MKPSTPHKAPHAGAVRPGLSRPMTSEERRRAQRVLLRINVKIHITGKPQIMDGYTQTVSATGGLILVPEPLAQGTKIVIENVKTQKTIEATIVRPPQFSPDGSLIPVEFAAPAPNFWNIFFPPVIN